MPQEKSLVWLGSPCCCLHLHGEPRLLETACSLLPAKLLREGALAGLLLPLPGTNPLSTAVARAWETGLGDPSLRDLATMTSSVCGTRVGLPTVMLCLAQIRSYIA